MRLCSCFSPLDHVALIKILEMLHYWHSVVSYWAAVFLTSSRENGLAGQLYGSELDISAITPRRSGSSLVKMGFLSAIIG